MAVGVGKMCLRLHGVVRRCLYELWRKVLLLLHHLLLDHLLLLEGGWLHVPVRRHLWRVVIVHGRRAYRHLLTLSRHVEVLALCHCRMLLLLLLLLLYHGLHVLHVLNCVDGAASPRSEAWIVGEVVGRHVIWMLVLGRQRRQTPIAVKIAHGRQRRPSRRRRRAPDNLCLLSTGSATKAY